MDIGQIAEIVAQSEQPKTIVVYQPNGEPYRGADGKESTLSHVGSESKAYKAARDVITRRALNARRHKLTPEELMANRIDLAAATLTEWSGWESGGKPFAFTPDNARKLLAAEHILTQLEESVTDFFVGSATSSNSSPKR